jgi:16S rRNA G966 N2-methylase RsmD
VQQDCFSFLEQTHQKFDLIFADPPYDMPDFERIAKLVFERELLRPDGMLIIEHSRNTSLHSFQQYSHTRNYGSVHFSFFEAQ